MTALALSGVSRSFGATAALRNVSLAVEESEFCVIVGPSGCGKSTLLRVIAGLEGVDSGEILLDGEVINHVAPAKRGIAMVFQSYALYPHLTAAGNMALGLKQEGLARTRIQERIAEAARMLSLESFLDRRPAELSGGQRQRVAIGRAVTRQPRLFLFDEPLSNLDAALRMNTRLEIARLHRALAVAMVYVTHDQVEAMTLADRIVVLREGRVEQIGAPMELYNRPANRFVAGFIGAPAMNFLPGRTLGEQTHEVGIRPEHLHLGHGPIRGTVMHVEQLGADTNVLVDAGLAAPVTLRLFGQHDVRPEAKLSLGCDPAHVHRFGPDGRRLG